MITVHLHFVNNYYDVEWTKEYQEFSDKDKVDFGTVFVSLDQIRMTS